ELLKELERSTGNLRGLLQNPKVDHERLGTILRALEHLTVNLHGLPAQPGQALREDSFITSIRQRSSIPGGTCDFDLPIYHWWLDQSWKIREQEQKRWYSSLNAVRQAIEMLLKMIRNSAEPRTLSTDNGSYQQQLDSNIPYQMVRVMLPDNSPYYTEISGSKHRFSLRFLKQGQGKAGVAEDTVNFKLSCCNL
ncbi:MAG: cell division protein ZapD, partial [Gammaproteobacteria bacterium]|nr:cell division protein ZapD [Gammaproteobacteria bacterium]NIR93606.1 cell division protein ZapD [Gammaproteobacteria bacterium]